MSDNDWFIDWFNSPYYHILYKDRDDIEAKKFISNLIKHLNPYTEDFLLDVACGKGRHAVFMASLGYYVEGFDLSENSIAHAKEFESEFLKFYINDIRTPSKINYYQYAFNLFTSFGYFDDYQDNQKAINAIAESLTDNGVLVMDFMNCNKVINNLTQKEVKTVDNVKFNITRSYNNGHIIKDIEFKDKGVNFNYQENVKAISLSEFKNYFNTANLNIESIFGDYELNSFDIESSDRLIIIARKN
ncbi:MAG: class I SAM-dependent methyltransferase [Vicingaceae bacterium]|nr:class I SAM-dependent methyltransferase [Vicingaceae bacterium]